MSLHPPQRSQETQNFRQELDSLTQSQMKEIRYEELLAKYNALQERFTFIQRATQDAVWDWNLIDNVGWYSEGLKVLFGYDPNAIGDGVTFWYSTIHPDDEKRVVAGIHAVIDNGGKNWSDRYRFRRADGTYAWVFDRGYAIHDDTGRPVRMVGSMQDVTKEMEARQGLQESDDRLRLAVESAQLGTWDFHPLTGVLTWDKRCKELFGLSPDAYVDYEVFLKALHPEDRERTHRINQFAMSAESGGYYDTEYRTIGIEDQKLRWVRAKGRSYFDENGAGIRYIGTVLDITAEKEREEKLKEQEERFRLLATMIPQIVWTTNADGVCDYITDKWEAYTGQKPDYAFGSFKALMHEDDREVVMAKWKECHDTGQPLYFEYRLKNVKTGDYRWFFGSSVPLKDAQGKVIKWIGSATDIHDQKMVEMNLEKRVEERTRELSELNARLGKSNEELEQYAYVASHDLKEPLRKIQTYSNLIADRFGAGLPEEVLTYLQKIESSALRMSELIKDLLEYSRVSEADSLLEKVDISEVVRHVQADFELVLKEKGIAVKTGKLPVLQAVGMQMHQLFFNLFSNAIKFSRSDVANVITVSSQLLGEAERIYYPGLNPHRDFYKIVFSDQGIGFNPKYNEQIFTIFQRLNSSKTFEGHGIGLALCRKIVNNHHGAIHAKGVEGKGAEFTIVLPAAE